MGLPAIKRELVQPARPLLRLIKPTPAKPRRSGKRAALEAARRRFATCAVLTVLAATLGVGRVWLSVQATETSFQAFELKNDIKSERYEGDMLEVRQSALGSPSRIKAIAGSAMDMAPAADVTYLDITESKKVDTVKADALPGRSGLASVLTGLLDLTAGEAHVLLVGDVGLASTPR